MPKVARMNKERRAAQSRPGSSSNETPKQSSRADASSNENQRRRASSEASATASELPANSEIEPCDNDVILGRGRARKSHPGNRHMHDLVTAQRPQYNRAKRDGKKDITCIIVKEIREKGGRFLKKRDSGWYEITEEEARLKVSHAMRDGVDRAENLKTTRIEREECPNPRSIGQQQSAPVARVEQHSDSLLPTRQEIVASQAAGTDFRPEQHTTVIDPQTAAILNQIGRLHPYHFLLLNTQPQDERLLRALALPSLQALVATRRGQENATFLAPSALTTIAIPTTRTAVVGPYEAAVLQQQLARNLSELRWN